MTPRVRILPDRVANQIAAGEVVERPASVVKELVENALDAGARRIEVSLRNGGKTEIRVADDGTGMDRQDALLALDRHATSKIREAGDLDRISSLGFRGEALPSIAAVSRMELETSTEGEAAGTRVRVRAGRVEAVEEVVRRRGTTVTVRGLFQNVPARARFLRTAAAETRACSETVTLLALAHLAVAFRLASNGRELLELPPASTPVERVASLWGREVAGTMLETERAEGELRLGGLIQRPDAARRGARRRHLFVNGRPFEDRALHRAVDEAYRTTLPRGVHPAFVLYLGVPPGEVDVNVHPAKLEVRFRRREEIERLLRETVRERLSGLESAAPLGPGSQGTPGGVAGSPAAPPRVREVPGRETPPVVPGRRDADPVGRGAEGARSVAEAGGSVAEAGGSVAEGARSAADVSRGREGAGQLAFFVPDATVEEGAGGAAGGETRPAALSPVRPPDLWQLHASYILAATRDGLLIVDQHAAHERVLFEELMERFEGEREEASQRLLFPVTLRLTPAEISAVEELGGILERVGFEVDIFGNHTVILRAAPAPHPRFDAETCFREMIHELAHGSPLVDSARNQHERVAKSLACKGAVKAGQVLEPREMAELFDRLFATELPGHDVHGRPTVVRLGLDELERRFGRG